MPYSVFDVVSQLITISPELRTDLESRLQHGTYPKRTHLLRQGQISNYLYFVTEGLLRAYHTDEDGEDVSSWFMMENDFFISVLSFYNREPSREAIEVLEDCALTYIDYNDLMELYARHTEFNIVGRILTERYYCQSELRLTFMRRKSATYKYNVLLENYPELIKRVPNKYIASYLGMSVFTLSRIKGAGR